MTGEIARVLVVDDDKVNRMMLSHALRQEGYEAVASGGGQEALELVEAEPFDVVLLDVLMPDMDGFEVLGSIKSNPRLRHLPVIMISGLEDTDGVVRCIELGAEDFLPKPFDPVLLRARMNAGLAKKRIHDLQIAYQESMKNHADELERLNAELNRRVEEQVTQLQRLSRLRRFLSPHLAEAIVSSGDESILEVHRRQIAVAFFDLRGFTGFSETSAPEEVMGVLDQFHAALGALVPRFEATVGYFAGDGIMVFFNDPLHCEDPALRAVQMAAALQEDIVALRADWRRTKDIDLRCGVGIALGYATLGQLGFEGRYDYSAIGPVVNLASRLCDQARGEDGDILLDQAAYNAVEGVVKVDPLGPVELKGFTRARSAYRLLALHAPDGAGGP